MSAGEYWRESSVRRSSQKSKTKTPPLQHLRRTTAALNTASYSFEPSERIIMWRINYHSCSSHKICTSIERTVSFSRCGNQYHRHALLPTTARCRHSNSNDDITLESSASPSTSSKSSTSPSSSTIQIATSIVQPLHSLLHKIQQFQNGLSRLKFDYLRSIYIQDAELTRQHLQRKIRSNYEQYRQRILHSTRHGGIVGRHVVHLPGKQTSISSNSSSLKIIAYPEQEKKNQVSPIISNNSNFGNNSLILHHHQNDHHNKQLPLSKQYSSLDRRSQEHLRALTRDLQTTLPTVAAFLFIPFFGYAFLILGMMFPRVLLSRQFHTTEQRWEFAMVEYSQRQTWFDRLNTDFWGGCMRQMPKLRLVSCHSKEKKEKDHMKNMDTEDVECIERAVVGKHDESILLPFLEPLTYVEMDAAGPVFDKQSMRRLYNLCRHNFSSGGGGKERYSILDHLQSTHLHSISLANNLATTVALPPTLAHMVLQTCVPSIYLKRRLIALAQDIILDDIALIQEGTISSECMGLTDEEVLEACWIRGLPMGKEGEVHMLRRLLKHHLQMMESIMACSIGGSARGGTSPTLCSKGELARDRILILLVLHLASIRYSMRKC